MRLSSLVPILPSSLGTFCTLGASCTLALGLATLASYPSYASTGSWWNGFESGLSSSTGAAQVTAFMNLAGHLIVAGRFDEAESQPVSNVAQWNGERWSPMADGLNDRSHALLRFDRFTFAGGDFTASGTRPLAHLAAWNGSSWLDVGGGVDGPVHALARLEDHLVVGGDFLSAGGVATPHLALWDGATWTSLGTFDARVEALLVLDGQLYVGGSFTAVDETEIRHLALWDGSSWTEVGGGTSGPVRALTVFQGNLIIGGSFDQAGTLPVSNLASWDGSSWSALGAGVDGDVLTLAHFRNTLAVGGDFANAGAVSALRVARWNGSEWSGLGSGFDDTVRVLRQDDGHLYAGGDFDTAGGESSRAVARWQVNSSDPLAYLVQSDGRGDFANIQDAVDATAWIARDSVWVGPGNYDEEVYVLDKFIHLRSTQGRESTELRFLDWHGDDSRSFSRRSSFHGFTVHQPATVRGVDFPDMRIEDCRFHESFAANGYGRDILITTSELLNSADFYLSEGSISMWECVVVGSVSAQPDGNNAGASFNECSFSSGSLVAGGRDGASVRDSEFFDMSHVTLYGSRYGTASLSGSSLENVGEIGISSERSSARENSFTNCGLLSIAAGSWDGDNIPAVNVTENLFVDSDGVAAASVRHNIERNVLIRCDEGLRIRVSGNRPSEIPDVRIVSNTIVGGSSVGITVPVLERQGSSELLQNIVINNVVGIEVEHNEEPGDRTGESDDGLPTMNCNLVWNNEIADWLGVADPTGTLGNLSADPLFCDPDFDNLTLRSDSPATGDPDVYCALIGALEVGCGDASTVPSGAGDGSIATVATRGLYFENPVTSHSVLEWTGQVEFETRLDLYSSAGRLVLSLEMGPTPEQVVWTGLDSSGRTLPAGLYFWRWKDGGSSATRKMIVID